jgi:hypothetical protein
MVQDELIRLRVRFEAGALLAFEAAIAFEEVQRDPEGRSWLRLSTALAMYLTAEYAIQSARATLELIGGNGYTSDCSIERILRDAQVLTVWEGTANIQALELLRLLAPRYRGWEQYQARLQGIVERMPDALGKLRRALETRLADDREAVQITRRDEVSSQRFARTLLHRLSESLAFALLCEAAVAGYQEGFLSQQCSSQRYQDEIAPQAFGNEDETARRGVLELLEEESAQLTRASSKD